MTKLPHLPRPTPQPQELTEFIPWAVSGSNDVGELRWQILLLPLQLLHCHGHYLSGFQTGHPELFIKIKIS